ncbi:MAG TPA: pyridoxal kinase PdxY [Azospirillaceae bacterium]|nr:pyridoxal kinase PdxY [Azospirillaceae bacterium]
MPNILSIQSHVAYGHVGNAAAVFPMQRLGFEVWPIHTVQFSNHTGYGSWTGQVFTPDHIGSIVEGIAARGVMGACDAVLSGYMGDATLGTAVLDTVARARAANPKALYCCDPVMGDVGRGFFVRPGIPDFMRERAVPAADIITPNQFELEYLTGIQVRSLDDAVAAGAKARAMGPRFVLLTSLTRSDASADVIEMLLDGPGGTWVVVTPRLAIEPPPNGAGDCTAALFLAHLLRTDDPAQALELAAAGIFAVFDATKKAGTRELQLVAAQDQFANPARRFDVRQIR